jgi:hypothetical protein
MVACVRQGESNTSVTMPRMCWPFETAFNLKSPGIYDIFAPLSDSGSAAFPALFAIEADCKDHSEKTFANALLTLAAKMEVTLLGGQ